MQKGTASVWPLLLLHWRLPLLAGSLPGQGAATAVAVRGQGALAAIAHSLAQRAPVQPAC